MTVGEEVDVHRKNADALHQITPRLNTPRPNNSVPPYTLYKVINVLKGAYRT